MKKNKIILLRVLLIVILPSVCFFSRALALNPNAEVSPTSENLRERLARFNELTQKIASKKFVGGKDEESLEVQTYLFKPERGATLQGMPPPSESVEEDHSAD